ncbi:MAG: phage antirepressor protein [Acidobacteria bacterium]|nr:MAG: phage antirepressor protein [Acidobacteriota bacterium]
MPNQLILFQGKEIRKILHQNEWWFAVIDVVEVLTNSKNPQDYIKKMRKRDEELAKGWGQIVTPLSLKTPGGRQKLACANTKGIFRIIQSIPSPKAEPFKRWLAKVGYERVQEIEDPELTMQRMRETYKLKGYSNEWIEKRIRGMEVRKALTEEWNHRDIEESNDYAILTAEISKAAFGLTPEQYNKYKGLTRPSENLRDHMTDLELIFTMLGEASTTEIAQTRDVQGMLANRKAAWEGGSVAGKARDELEKRSGRTVVSKNNYKEIPESIQRKKLE